MAWYELDFTWIHLNLLKLVGIVSDFQITTLDSEVARRKAA
ncbi:MAG: acyl-CoA desaturase, partial [Candidatus Hydrogenedentes bacterium]|nr:acyl-CoA desaturase [Candidatus Hydrogenedentota bacterium]